MQQKINGDETKTWVKEQIKQARLAKAREAVKRGVLASHADTMSEALLLHIAANLENPKRMMRKVFEAHKQTRRRPYLNQEFTG